jgi:hypothetical protein
LYKDIFSIKIFKKIYYLLSKELHWPAAAQQQSIQGACDELSTAQQFM